ncbi:MAG: DUF3047 domain-containing protein [Pseudomonadota bacterium]
MRQAIPLLILLIFPLSATAGEVMVGRFSTGDLRGWQEESFVGHTSYRIDEQGGVKRLHAKSNNAASVFYKRVNIDPDATPLLNWSWRVGDLFGNNDEQSRVGDDYPARIYVVFSGGPFFLPGHAINYVWSSNQPVGTHWKSAYTGSSRMIAVNSGSEQLGQWVTLQRDVLADYRLLFGEEPGSIDTVAVMTDTDNTGRKARAWYGDIWFSAPAKP